MQKLVDVLASHDNCHVLIVIINGTGDAFLALPVIRYIAQHLGEEHITVWGRKCFLSTVYAELGRLFLPLSTSPTSPTMNLEYEIARLQRRIPANRDIVWVSLNSYATEEPEAYAIARLKPMYRWHYDIAGVRRDPISGRHFHRADQYFRVIGETAMPSHVSRRPRIVDVDDCFAKNIRMQAVSQSKYLVTVHSETAVCKQWPLRCWIELGARLAGIADLVLLGRGDQSLAKNKDFKFHGEAWGIQIALISNADFFIGIDSCFAHVADSFSVPGVVMFSNTDVTAIEMIDRWGPKSATLAPLASPTGELGALEVATVLGTLGKLGLLTPDSCSHETLGIR